MKDPLSNDPSGSTPIDNSKEPMKILGEGNRPWYEGFSTTEACYNFYQKILTTVLPRFRYSRYLAEVCTDKIFENLLLKPPTSKQRDAYLKGKTGQIRRRMIDTWRSPLYHEEGATQNFYIQDERAQDKNNESVLKELSQPSAENTFFESEVRRELYRAIEDYLTPRERACLVLRVYDNKSAKEVAQMLGITPDSVNTAVNQAKEKLRKHLFEEDP